MVHSLSLIYLLLRTECQKCKKGWSNLLVRGVGGINKDDPDSTMVTTRHGCHRTSLGQYEFCGLFQEPNPLRGSERGLDKTTGYPCSMFVSYHKRTESKGHEEGIVYYCQGCEILIDPL